ncbi:hypothetical protein BST97_13910 [Nonlabens spongiae]|uniref:Uncharacterized protein n=2 Tax=Nonlabens spongiae TaxID=331648 RepID=A0A1W6MN24_9FLAO|nr:hypothetical protein BST97_13910 [Nonlabens spongiae]
MAIERAKGCADCPIARKHPCHMLETPFPQISLAFSYEELLEVSDLLAGTWFELELQKILSGL